MALTQVTSAGLKDGEIVNADLHSAASIALSKLASTGALGSAVTATTQSASDDSTKIATTAFVQAAVTSLIDGAPGSLNTLNELAAAINDDSSYATTLTTALATKAVLTGSTNNTIATVTGSNALTGEASLTFDAGLLKIDDLSGTAGKGRLEFGNSGEQYIEGFDTGNGGSGSYLSFGDGGAEYLRISNTGDIGIGTNSPSNWGPSVHIKGTDPCLLLEDSATAVDYYGVNITAGAVTTWFDDAAYFAIGTATGLTGSSLSERLRINSSGQLLSGVTDNAGAADANAVFGGGSAGTGNYGKIYITQNQSNPTANTAIGFVGFSTQDVSNTPYAFMGVYADGNHGTNDYPSRFSFWTTPDGSNSVAERLRITSDGFLLLGTTDTGFSSGYTNMTIGNTSTQNTGLTIASSASNGYSRVHFADGNSGSAKYAGWIAYDHAADTLKMSSGNAGSYKFAMDSVGRVTKPFQPRFCIIGGSNMYNNTESNVWNGNDWAPQSGVNSGNAVHVNVGSHYTVSNGRWTAPIAGTYYFFFRGTTGSNHSHFVYIAKNDSGVGGDLGLEYSAGHDHMNVGGGILTTCSAGDYFTFKRRGSGYRFYSLVWGGWLIA